MSLIVLYQKNDDTQSFKEQYKKISIDENLDTHEQYYTAYVYEDNLRYSPKMSMKLPSEESIILNLFKKRTFNKIWWKEIVDLNKLDGIMVNFYY